MVESERFLDEDGYIGYTIKSDVKKAVFGVRKAQNGYSSYIVTIDRGHIPTELEGWFTTPEKALEHVTKYLERAKPSPSVKRDINTARREAQKKELADGSKSKSANTKPVQQRSSD
jgi:hypothetical protein